MISRLRLALALLAVVAIPGWADVHPNTAGGFPVDQSFHVGDIDNVNLFNGALTVTIPIGPSYPVNGGFSYSLKLVSNSSPWFFQTVHSPNPLTGQDTTYIQANPNPCSNAGLGWRVSLGRFNPPCQVPDSNNNLPGPVYQDEMGTDHVFYPTLHAGDPEDAASFLPGPAALAAGPEALGSLLAGAGEGEVVISTGSRVASLATKLENIFTHNLTNATAEAAARESLGEVVARKATGEAFDHVEKFATAREGATRTIDTLKRAVGNQRLTDAERGFAQYLLSKYSKALDAVEKVYNLALAASGSSPK